MASAPCSPASGPSPSPSKKKKNRNRKKTGAGSASCTPQRQDGGDDDTVGATTPSLRSPKQPWLFQRHVRATPVFKATGPGGTSTSVVIPQWRRDAAFMHPRTMETADIPLGQVVAVCTVRTAENSSVLSTDDKQDSDDSTMRSSRPATVVGYFTVWPSNELHPRNIGVAISVVSHDDIGYGVVAKAIANTTRVSTFVKDELVGYNVARGLSLPSSVMGHAVSLLVTAAMDHESEATWDAVAATDGDDEHNGVSIREHCALKVTDATEVVLHAIISAAPGGAPGDSGGNPHVLPRGLRQDSGSDQTPPISYESIGGLGSQIAQIRDLIELPLRRPHLFRSFGVRPPSGVLLVGPPGTGKTMIARACACASGAYAITINGPEIISKFYGESERKLREVFTHARANAPALIFIDEIDALCPSREQATSELEKRIVATVLTLMDGANTVDVPTGDHRNAPEHTSLSSTSNVAGGGAECSYSDTSGGTGRGVVSGGTTHGRVGGATGTGGHVLVIGATNRPQALDAAVRRPGRFDREIEIGVPNAPGREEILQAMLRTTPNELTTGDIHTIASVTHGYVGADLAAVCNEGALVATRRAIRVHQQPMQRDALPVRAQPDASAPEIISASTPPVFSDSDVPASHELATPSVAEMVVLRMEDMREGLQRVRPSAMREVYVDVPTVKWTDIGGQEDTKQQLREAVEWPLKHPDAFARMGIRPPRGILLYGPPGCSKTLMAKALATESSLNFLAVKGPELFSKWVGESEKAVRDVFRKARGAAPSIVFFDEIDSLAAQRSESGGGKGVGERVLSQLLSEMDGVEAMGDVTVVAATNRPDMIDPALLRPGRMDRMIYVGPPDVSARKQILERALSTIPHTADVDITVLASTHTHGFSGAEVVALCRDAALCAMRDNPRNASTVTMTQLTQAANAIVKNITPQMLHFYSTYQDKIHPGAKTQPAQNAPLQFSLDAPLQFGDPSKPMTFNFSASRS